MWMEAAVAKYGRGNFRWIAMVGDLSAMYDDTANLGKDPLFRTCFAVASQPKGLIRVPLPYQTRSARLAAAGLPKTKSRQTKTKSKAKWQWDCFALASKYEFYLRPADRPPS